MRNLHIHLAEWSNSTDHVEGIDSFVKVVYNSYSFANKNISEYQTKTVKSL